MQLIASLNARNPIGEGIESAAKSIGGAIGQLGMERRASQRADQGVLNELATSGRLEQLPRTGTMVGGRPVMDDYAAAPSGMTPLSELLPGMGSRAAGYAVRRPMDQVPVTDALIANYPHLGKMGYQAGDVVSTANLKVQEDADALTAAERQLWGPKVGKKPDELIGVRLSALRGLVDDKKRPKDEGLTEAQKMVDRQFGKEYADFVLAGGYSDVQKQLGQLQGVVTDLIGKGTAEKPSGVNASGTSGVLPKFLRDVVATKGAAVQDTVEDVVQRNLRNVLGAQFTEKEGTRLIERAWNPRQPEAENIKRVGRLITQIDEAAKSKAEAGAYYEEHGTLVGFKGKLYRSADDFLRDAVKDTKAPGASGGGLRGAPDIALTGEKAKRLAELREKMAKKGAKK